MDRPGAAFDMTRIMNTPEGRVIFGGGDIDDSVWRVSMEGAVNSGHRCASHVLSRLGL
jgi:monoamine oxidase